MQQQKFCGREFALVNNLSSFQLDMSKDHRSLCFCLNINSRVKFYFTRWPRDNITSIWITLDLFIHGNEIISNWWSKKRLKTPVFNSFFQVAAEKTVRVCKLQWMSHAQIFLSAVSPTRTFHPALRKHKTEKTKWGNYRAWQEFLYKCADALFALVG